MYCKHMSSLKTKIGLMLVISLLMTGNMLSMKAFSMDEGDGVVTVDKNNPPDGVWVGYEVSHERVVVDTRLEQYGWLGGGFSRLVDVYEIRPCCQLTGRKFMGCSVGVKCSQ